jgi:hypothetical protein
MKPDGERDTELGATLRRALDPGDDRVFVARVLARIDDAPVALLFWDLLASWARRGIPAVIMIAALTAFLITLPRQPAANLEDTLAGGAGPDASFLASPASLDNRVPANTP